MIINQIGGNASVSAQKNTGPDKQKIEARIKKYALAKGSFDMSLGEAVTKSKWDEAKRNKDIVMFWLVEEAPEANNTEPTIKEGSYTKYKIKEGITGISLSHYLSVKAHEALKSFEDSGYARFFEITEENELGCFVDDNMRVKGLPITSMTVDPRLPNTGDTPPLSKVHFTFGNTQKSILKPEFSLSDEYEGIHDLVVTQVSAATGSLRFKVNDAFLGDGLRSLIQANIELTDSTGTVKASSFVAADNDGVYELTGAGFQNGDIIKINGVITIAGTMYEGENELVVSGI